MKFIFWFIYLVVTLLQGCVGSALSNLDNSNLIISPSSLIINPADGTNTQLITLYNTGTESITTISLNPTTPLSITNNSCNTILNPNNNCTFKITTTTNLTNSGTANVIVNYTDAHINYNSAINVTYLVKNPKPYIKILTLFDLLNTPIGYGTSYLPLTINNMGNTPLYNIKFNNINHINSAMQYGGIGNTCNINTSFTLNPNESCILIIGYTPTIIESNNFNIIANADYYDQYGHLLSYNNLLNVLYSTINSSPIYAFGTYGVIESSNNGSTWRSITNVPFTNNTIITNTITNNNTLYLIGNSDGTMYKSLNGLFHNNIASIGNNSIIGLVYYNGVYHLAGGISNKNISTSTNLNSWSTIFTANIQINNLVNLNNLFIATLNTNIATSTNGSSWLNQTISGNRQYATSLFDGSNYYVLGNNGYIAYSSTGVSNWQILNRIIGKPNITSSIYANGHYVATANNGSIYSTNNPISGRWNRQNLSIYPLNSIAHGNNSFVAVGDNGLIANITTLNNWNNINLGITNKLSNVYFDGKLFWVTGQNIIINSSDGINWNYPSINNAILNNNNLVAIGNDGNIYYSNNGLNWQIESLPTTNSMRNVYCSSINNCIVVGNNGVILTSTTGANNTISTN